MAGNVGFKSSTNLKSILIVTLCSLGYLLICILLIGLKTEQLLLVFIFNILFYSTAITRKLALGLLIFIVYWVIFDFMKALPNYAVNRVHIADIYNLEKKFFGIRFNGKLITPNEYCRLNSNNFLDVVGGIFYLCWIPVPIGFALFLFFRDRRQFLYFALTFLTVNLIGFVIYYLFPAAPPWYLQQHGFVFEATTPGSTAGLARFDQYFHIHIFKSIYAKSSNVFAAMPSLHSAYPVIVVYYGLKNKLGLVNILLITVMLGIWLTAVYASHHYILDVIAGIICAISGIALFNFLANRVVFFKVRLNKYLLAIQ